MEGRRESQKHYLWKEGEEVVQRALFGPVCCAGCVREGLRKDMKGLGRCVSALLIFSPRVLIELAFLALTDCAPAVPLVVALAQRRRPVSPTLARWHCVVVPFLPLSGASQSRTTDTEGAARGWLGAPAMG